MTLLLYQIALIADCLLRAAVRTFAAGNAQALVNLRFALLHTYSTHGAALSAFGAANAGTFLHLHAEGTGHEAPQKVE